MKPIFKITADGNDISKVISERLIGMTITDVSGFESDCIEITLDDNEGKIEIPRRGVTFEVWLGYEETSLTKMGRYVIDEIELEGPPEIMIIRGKSANMRSSIKSPRNKTWEDTTLGNIISEIAQKNGLEPKIDRELENIEISSLCQTNESDLHFVTRLAKQYGALAKPAGESFLVFTRKGSGTSISGKPMPTVTLSKSDLIRWRISMTDRNSYQSVTARWKDLFDGEEHKLTVGEGQPEYLIKKDFQDHNSAMLAAKNKLSNFKQGGSIIEIIIQGNPNIKTGTKLQIDKIKYHNTFIISDLNHYLSNDAYNTTIKSKEQCFTG
jgi:phage protein D